jgi:VWFA-related protein
MAFLAACFVTLAQSQQPPPSFRSGVSLVTVDVTVLDADGRPVPGLTAADFEVRLNNRVQPIRAVTYVQVAQTMAGAVGPSFDAAPLPPAPAAPKDPKNVPVTTVDRVFVLLVDDLSFAPMAGKELLAAAERFVATLPATDLIGVTTSSGTTATNPTTDRAPVLASLKKIAGVFQDPRFESYGPSAGPDQQAGIAQALDIDRGDMSVLKQAIANECFNGDIQVFNTQSVGEVLATSECARTVKVSATRTAAQMKAIVQRQAQAFEAVIRAMRSASGIRHLVVLTDGVALSQDNQTMIPVARAAAEAGVQLSTMMATGDISLTDQGRRVSTRQRAQVDAGAPQRRREDNQMFLNGARTTTDMAGGEFYQVTGAPDRFFERIRASSSAIYRLAVEVPPDTKPGKDFALAARVMKRSGVTARANRHAVAAPPSPATPSSATPSSATPAAAPPPRALVPPAEQMRRAIATGRPLNGLDVSLERSVRRAADPAQVSIEVVAAISGAKAPVTTMFGLVEPGGAIRTADRNIDAPDANGAYRLTFSVPVAPGAYKLRFAAADAGGALGAAEAAVDATLTAMGPFQASGILVEPLPGSRRGVLAAIELYPTGPAPADVIVKIAIVAGSEPVNERVIVPEPVDGVLRAEAEFLLESLPPGAYTLRATVLYGATVVGTATRPLPR